MKPKYEDEFSALKVSHQRKTQLRWKRDRRCIICGKPLEPHEGLRCKKHRDAHNARQRIKTGCKPWKKGKPGRPPIDVAGKTKKHTSKS